MKRFLLYTVSFIWFQANAQKVGLVGNVLDEEKKPVEFATVSLLNPADSTLLHYCITNEKGRFEIKNISKGPFILQAAAFGYNSTSQFINLAKDSICIIVLGVPVNKLDEVTVEVAPILIKGDTIEYNSAAFKTRPDAVAEDLLKKLPGVEVGRDGNVKAQGENVSKVLVDGKEFFGDDPKVATKNLPADAVKKVQVYDKKSDESELTGIDDGSNEKIINLVLKDGKKSAMIGDLMAGYGTNNHYQAAAKIYRFKKKSQFAALGMLNNINQFGFTLTDYLSFSGGLRSLTSGDGMGMLLNNASVPVNMGQPVTGLITSGAGGLNYTYEKTKGKRFNISYIGNGSQKKLEETTYSHNFFGDGYFDKYDTLLSLAKKQGHTFQLNWRNKIDSTQNLIVRLNSSYALSAEQSNSTNRSLLGNELTNRAVYTSQDNNGQFNSMLNASYLKRLYSSWRVFKLTLDGSYANNVANTTLFNSTYYFNPTLLFNQNLFQDNTNAVLKYTAGTSITRKSGRNYYTEFAVKAGAENDALKRRQGFTSETTASVDSLSPDFNVLYYYIRPGINFKKNTDKREFNINLRTEFCQLHNILNGTTIRATNYFFLLPELNWENEYRSQKRIGFNYFSYVNTAGSYQAMPVVNPLNPLLLFTGNACLRPEYVHDAGLNWWIFDQFSMTSFFAGVRGTYTHDKISYARNILTGLSQEMSMINVPDDYRLNGNLNFSTPVRQLKLNLGIKFSETWNKNISLINGEPNITTSLTHGGGITLENRKKDKWNLNAGATIQYTQAAYSIGDMGSVNYYNYGYFGEIAYTPTRSFSFFVSGDVNSYNGANFNESIIIPILKAEIKFYFLKDKRGTLSFEGFDLLNKNKGLSRVSELNYIMQKKSSIIQQYFMVSFKFKLNKFDANHGVDIQINKR
ncbi:MAG TPA: outer membrane beta-barrel protein [Flavobacteriales bacterium]|nr:outer membrane beta-barrel protein [Flavobacteriales bacterium]